MFALSVFLDCPEPLRYQRKLRRDVAQRGRTRTSVRRQFVETVVPMHNRYVQPQIRWAEVVLKRTPDRHQVMVLADRIQELLKQELA